MWISPTNTMAPGCSTRGARSGSRSRSGWSQPDHGSTAMRKGDFEVTLVGNCNNVPNPPLDVQRYLPRSVFTENYGNFDDQQEIDLYQRMLRETDPARQRALMRDFEKYVLDDQAHAVFLLWWYRIVPHRSYVKGWKIGPSHYLNQDLATVWLDQ